MSDTSHNDHGYQNASQFDPHGGSDSCYETMVDLITNHMISKKSTNSLQMTGERIKGLYFPRRIEESI